MGYLGRSPAVGTQRLLDSIESQFNGTLVTFDLRYGTTPTYPTLSASLIVSLGGVLQEPGAAYYVSSDKIVFSEAPLAGTECWILLYSQYGTGVGSAQQGNLGAENLTLTGELRGPSTFVIDPASVGDDTGLVRIKGGLEVLGTTTTISSTTLTVADKNIVIGQGGSTLSSIDTAGIDFGSTAVRLRYNYNGGTASGLSIEGGNVGIGTTSPGNLLHLSTAGASYLQIQNTTAANSIYFGNSSGNGIIQVDGANSLNISINGSQRASIDSSGNVGINGAPANYVGYPNLRINGSSGGILDLSNNGTSVFRLTGDTTGAYYYTQNASYPHVWGAGVSERMRLTSTGLGIGTNNPASELDVKGEIRIYPASGNATVRFGSGGVEKGKIAVDSSSNLLIETAGYERARIRGDGTFEIKGAGTAGSSPAVSVNPSAPADSAVIDSSGRLGLGISNPGARLVVFGSGNIVRLGDGTNTFDVRFQGPNNWAVQLDTSADKFNISRNSISLVTVDSLGRLGIGTTAPSGFTNASPALALVNNNSTAYSATAFNASPNMVLCAGSASGAYNGIRFTSTGNNETSFGVVQEAGGAGAFVFQGYSGTSYFERLRIDSQGRVGIGTADPYSKVHIAVSSSSTALLLNNSAGGGGAYVDLDFATYNIIGLAGYANAPATIRVIDDGFYSGHITFRTKTSGTPGGASTEKMRLDASGNLGVGVVPSSTAANAAKLHVYSSSSNAAVIEQTSIYYHVMRGKIVGSVSNATAVPLFTAGGMYSCGLMVEVICRGTQALGASMWKDTITAWRLQTVGTYQNSGVNAATQLLVAGTHTSGTLSWTNVSTANPTLNYTQGANGYIVESIDVYVTARDGASITFNTSFQSFG